jgi:hypothetical protein
MRRAIRDIIRQEEAFRPMRIVAAIPEHGGAKKSNASTLRATAEDKRCVPMRHQRRLSRAGACAVKTDSARANPPAP